MSNELYLRFKADLRNVSLSRTLLVGFLCNLDLPVTLLNELKTSLSEGVTNAIVHGYLGDEQKEVELYFSYDEELITMIIHDHGVGIEDIDKALEPMYSTKLENERAGLGFTIMQVFSDTMEVESYKDMGTKVTLTKKYG